MYYQNISPASIDKILNVYLDETKDRNINMIIIGANDGETSDFLTKYIINQNITTILVEPIDYLFKDLQKKFGGWTNLYLENSAVYHRNCKKNMHRLDRIDGYPEWSVGLGSLNKKTVENHENQLKGIRQKIICEIVNCITFDKLVKKYKLTEIELLQVDTEGSDYDIIKSIDLDKYRPDIIITEYMHMTFYQYYSLIYHLQKNNYKVNSSDRSFDMIAVDSTILE